MAFSYKNNAKYNSNSITVFPSASAPTGTNGRVLSENMLASIGTSITSKNYVISGFNATYTSRQITFSSGSVYINGRCITTTNSISITLPNTNVGTSLTGAIVLALSKNSLGNVKGVTNTSHEGVILSVVETKDYREIQTNRDILILGYVYNLANNGNLSAENWFVNRDRFFKFDANHIYVDTSNMIDEIADDIKNLTNDDVVNNDAIHINRNDDTYNRDLSLQDYINLASKMWFVSKYGDQYNGSIDIVCNSSQTDADGVAGSRYITFWGSNTAKNSRTQDRVKIYYTSSSASVLGVNGAINITNGITSNGSLTSNTSIVSKYVVGNGEVSNISMLANSSGRYIKMKNTIIHETDTNAYINTPLPIQYNIQNNVTMNVSGNTTYIVHSKVVYNQGTTVSYGSNSNFSAVNNTKYYLGTNVITNLSTNANISMGNNAKVTIGNNSTLTLGNNSTLQVNNTKLYSNGKIETNSISLMGTTTYLYLCNNSTHPHFYYTTTSVNNVQLRNANLYINNGILSATKVYNAVYNDYAELYEKDNVNEEFNEGDVIEVNPHTGKYRKSIEDCSQFVVGVYSNTYGHLLGGKSNCSIEENLKTYIPVGLCGRVYVNTEDNNICVGDLMVSSSNGKARALRFNENVLGCVIGKALSKNVNGKVLMQIMLH